MSSVISVVGTAGGVGSSVLTASLAGSASHLGATVVALDARPFGGGLDVVLGADEEPGVRWRDLADIAGTVDGDDLLERLPLSRRCGVLSFDREMPIVPSAEVLGCVVRALRGVCDVVVVDAPRAGEVWEGAMADLSDDVVALTGTSIPALAAAAASVSHLDAVHDRVWLACRTDRGNADLPETLSGLLDLPLLGSVPTDPKVTTALLEGLPPPVKGPLARAVETMLAALRPMRRPA